MLSAGKGLDPMQTRAEVAATLPSAAAGRTATWIRPVARYAQWMAGTT